MPTILPEVVLSLVNELMSDVETIDGLARSMPGKVSQIEEGASGLAAASTTSDHLNEAMTLLQNLASNLDAERQFLNSLAQQMQDLINRR